MNLKVKAKLDPQFAPMSVVCREMREATAADGQDIVIAVERNKGYTTTYKTRIFKDGTGHDLSLGASWSATLDTLNFSS